MKYTCALCGQKQASSRIRAHTVLSREVCHTCASKYDNPAELGSAVQQAILGKKHLPPSMEQQQPTPREVILLTHISALGYTGVCDPLSAEGYRTTPRDEIEAEEV